ncbi:hypothetical protein DACRYDRAFT_25086 [Dacryopinax primogenitus]|uniref:CREG-like beta-barrel domain-containing protein n=1 Tax=Dacryopinax primogenitus (strain DJM 731) TaxID=1858805 RepID=M5FND5_DACPD|nr:uncharacterized protein DACRYDRAFT_25086 [Dacryopinax primogenitus]EJT97255.1 hypothetical protein DACRYDRAFT_25086 [Dacryopinax primogenitus]
MLRLLALTLLLITGFALADETVQDAARLARQLLQQETIGNLATVFPSSHPVLPGQPFSLMECFAPCHSNGSLTLLFLPIAQNNRNILASPYHSATLTVRVRDPSSPYDSEGKGWDSPASRGRVALIGNVTVTGKDGSDVEECYLESHPDAEGWLPGRKEAPHNAYWARFDPHHIYWVGGFGDEHYIGYIPLDLYQKAAPIVNGMSEPLIIQ